MTDSQRQLRKDICEVGRRLWQREMVASNEGNISARIDDDRILCTPTGVSKGFMDPNTLAMVTLDGSVLGDAKPSSEIGLHLAVYNQRADVGAVVHAHPPTATAFAIAGTNPPTNILSETATVFKSVPIAKYATPGTEEVAESVGPLLDEADVILLKNHGAMTMGPDLFEAYHRMEVLENFTRTALVTDLLGGAEPIPPERVDALQKEGPDPGSEMS